MRDKNGNYTTHAVVHYLLTDKGREEVTDTAWGTILALLSAISPDASTSTYNVMYIAGTKSCSTTYYLYGKAVALTIDMYD